MDISAGAGIYAWVAAIQQPIANNGLIIDLNHRGFFCVSNSSQSGVGVITGQNETTLTDWAPLAGGGIWRVINSFSRPGVLRVRLRGVLTAGDQGIYSCTIPDDNGNNITINVGLYPSGFSGELRDINILLPIRICI